MRFQHKPNTILSRDYSGGAGPVYKTYVVNQGEEPEKGMHPSTRKGYKEVQFLGNSVIETDDPEIIAFLRKLPDVICIDDEEAKKPKMYTEEEVQRMLAQAVQAERVTKDVPISVEVKSEPIGDLPFTEEPELEFTCDICGRECKNYLGMKIHRNSHFPPKKSKLAKRKAAIKVA